MSDEWFARPVLFVGDVDRSVDFYVKQLGFTEAWRYKGEGKARVAQVDWQGCELILSSQWPDKVGKGLMFIPPDVSVLDALRAELEGRIHKQEHRLGTARDAPRYVVIMTDRDLNPEEEALHRIAQRDQSLSRERLLSR